MANSYHMTYLSNKRMYESLVAIDNSNNKPSCQTAGGVTNLNEISNILDHKVLDFNENNTSSGLLEIVEQFPDLELTSIKYSSDGLSIHGYIFRNKKIMHELPTLIFCRGGNNISEINFKGGKYKLGEIRPSLFYLFQEILQLVNDGKVIVFASNYRGSTNSEGRDEFGGQDVNDIINLYPIIEKYKYSDHNRIALYGWSRGSMMALLVHRRVDWVRCLIVVAGCVDYIAEKEYRPEFSEFLSDNFDLDDDKLNERSAINWVDELSQSPILILHGSADKRVSVDNAYKLEKRLQDNNIPSKMVIYPEGDHGLNNYRDDVKDEIINWIDSFL